MPDETTEKPRKKRGRKKGTPKTGGRQKGTRNRNSLSVLAALDKANIPVIEMLVADIQFLEPTARIEKWFQLLHYCYPKLKEIEYSPPLPPASAPSAAAQPAAPASKDERFQLIRGQVPGKPEASGQ